MRSPIILGNKPRSGLIAFLALAGAFAAAPVNAQLFGTPKFKVVQSDDRFSTDGLSTYSGQWNRLSKRSIAGGTHIDGRGVFVEPTVIKRRADGTVERILLHVHNELTQDTTGTSGLLSFGRLSRITFLPDNGEPIALKIGLSEQRRSDFTNYDRVTGIASTEATEFGMAEISAEQYQRIMNAGALATKIDGDSRSAIFEAKHISKSFQENLRTFWNSHIKDGIAVTR